MFFAALQGTDHSYLFLALCPHCSVDGGGLSWHSELLAGHSQHSASCQAALTSAAALQSPDSVLKETGSQTEIRTKVTHQQAFLSTFTKYCDTDHLKHKLRQTRTNCRCSLTNKKINIFDWFLEQGGLMVSLGHPATTLANSEHIHTYNNCLLFGLQ